MTNEAMLPDSSQNSYTRANLRSILAERSNLKSEVEKWWKASGFGAPPLPDIPNMAILARQVATFRYEDAAFVKHAEGEGLTPVWFEYTGDKLSQESSFKRSLIEVHVSKGRGKRGGLKTKSIETVANLSEWNGKPLNTVMTSSGNLVDFHHAIQDRIRPGSLRIDGTDWVKKMGGAKRYYEAYLSVFIAHAILFEDFHGGESGKTLHSFTATVFEPAWRTVTARFGATPLITPLAWSPEYRFYPADASWLEDGVV